MKAPAFWWRRPGPAAWALAPAGALYGAVAAARMRQPGQRARMPVICVGNVTVGGSGKTPTALALGALLAAQGHRPAFLTRGYGGNLAGPVQVDPSRHSAADVGDEALLLARGLPTIVARHRPAGAELAARLGADLMVMDDGLQNPSLVKDFSLAVFDAAVGVGNGFCLPAGPLRAPMAVQWERIDAVLLVGSGAPGEAVAAEAERRGLAVFRSRLVPEPEAASRLQGARVLAFAGIGRPAKFFQTLEDCGAELVATRAFPDHHAFTAQDIASLVAQAGRGGLRLVTTKKDAVRLARLSLADPGLSAVETLPVRLEIDAADALVALVLERIRAPVRPAAAVPLTSPGRVP